VTGDASCTINQQKMSEHEALMGWKNNLIDDTAAAADALKTISLSVRLS
jgi:hypothetical protein